MSLTDLPPDKMTIKTAAMVNVYQSEKTRFEKVRKEESEPNVPK
jgi:hypothetical protein